MLNPFPDLLSLSFFAPFLLRVMLGVWLVLSSCRHFKRRGELATVLASRFGALGQIAVWLIIFVECAVGAALVAGFYTQIAALLSGAYALKLLYFRRLSPGLAQESAWFYILVAAISLSLLVTGAGAFAVDVPL